MKLVIAAVALAAGCHAAAGCQSPDATGVDASAGERLASLCDTAWERELRANPRMATQLGDERFHGELEDLSPAAGLRRAQDLQVWLTQLASIAPDDLDATERVTVELLREQWALELATHELGIDLPSWNLNPREGPASDYLSLGEVQPTASAREREQLLARWSRMPDAIRQCAANLGRGLANGRVASRKAVERTHEQVVGILGTAPEDSPLVSPGLGGGRFVARNEGDARGALEVGSSERLFVPSTGDALTAAERQAFVTALLTLVRERIYPAFAEYGATLQQRVLPEARSDAQPGVCHVAGGAAYYLACIRTHTSLELAPEEIHRIGLAEVARIRAEMAELGARVFGARDVAVIATRLRTDPALHFANADEIEAKAAECLERGRLAMPAAFGIKPVADCEVLRVPPHEAPHTTIAYYNEPAADGSRPGRYYINTYAPTTRPRYDAEVLAFHESIPGHHLQIAIAQELAGLPPQRRFGGSTAFVEGWALYTERLCQELELYSSDLDLLGVLSFDAWRACRLVVDTGLHAFGWTRDQAIAYMRANTLLAENNIENEVDRYIAWPGQALAYKLGQLEILALRTQAEQALGADFELSQFHDNVLRHGAVTLRVLRGEIEAWSGIREP